MQYSLVDLTNFSQFKISTFVGNFIFVHHCEKRRQRGGFSLINFDLNFDLIFDLNFDLNLLK